jgi:type II secretion system protein G
MREMQCPHCESLLNAPTEGGITVNCGACGNQFKTPIPTAPVVPPNDSSNPFEVNMSSSRRSTRSVRRRSSSSGIFSTAGGVFLGMLLFVGLLVAIPYGIYLYYPFSSQQSTGNDSTKPQMEITINHHFKDLELFSTSKEDEARTLLQALSLPLNNYRMHVGQFPSSESGLEALRTAPADGNLQRKWRGPYIHNTFPAKDPWGNDCFYKRAGVGYVLRSGGPDGMLNNADDIVVTHVR